MVPAFMFRQETSSEFVVASGRGAVCKMALLDRNCMNRVGTGAAVGGALGASIGAMYGTYEAFRYKVPGLHKVRYIGQTTLSSAAVFGLFLGAGSLLHCGR
ncbi:hypothetical protein D9Q98_003036 [Chlorella vulgaris]|uniref:Reactive oxygen species modulator 1 n=1 Tax=Chlorella vulgaris TaxID=3077 RepID=A0A9D4TUW1_CHLVU|nr:hypothetical protein D9Q98_003036 [Chlorella vulgaris]